MKAVTICQPYAHLVALGEKPIENRTWPTHYRGEIAIHAGKSRDWLDEEDEKRYPELAFGAVIAVAQLVACLSLRVTSPWPAPFAHLMDHEHANGPWCWVLADIVRIEPVPCRGAQGLWSLPADVDALVRERFEEAA